MLASDGAVTNVRLNRRDIAFVRQHFGGIHRFVRVDGDGPLLVA